MTYTQKARYEALKAKNYTERMQGRKPRKDPVTKKPLIDNQGNVVYVKPRKHWSLYSVQPSTLPALPITDSGASYILHIAPRMAYTALKNAWVNSGNPYLYRIMCMAPDTIRRGHSVEWLSDTECIRGDDEEKPLVTMTYKRRRVKIAGVWHTTERKQLRLTKKARERNATIASKGTPFYNVSLAFDDLVGVAVLELTKLAHIGALQNYDDCWQVRRFIYQAVNRAIHAERRIDNQTRENTIFTESGKLDIIARKAGKGPGFTPRELWEKAALLVELYGGTNTDIRILYARGAGYTQAEIGTIVGLAQRTVSKRLAKFRERMERGGLHRNIADYRARATERSKA